MGITMVSLGNGKVQLLHSFYNAKSPEDAERGLIFMQEMIELSKTNSLPATELQAISYKVVIDGTLEKLEILSAGPSHFGPELVADQAVTSTAVYADPLKLCTGGSLMKFLNLDF